MECGQCLAHSWTAVNGGYRQHLCQGCASPRKPWSQHQDHLPFGASSEAPMPTPPPDLSTGLGLPWGSAQTLLVQTGSVNPGEQAQQVAESHQPWAEERHAGHQAEEFAKMEPRLNMPWSGQGWKRLQFLRQTEKSSTSVWRGGSVHNIPTGNWGISFLKTSGLKFYCSC